MQPLSQQSVKLSKTSLNFIFLSSKSSSLQIQHVKQVKTSIYFCATLKSDILDFNKDI